MRTAKVFKSGNSQAVRIPKEFQLDVEDVEILQQGNDLIIRKPHSNASALLKVFKGFSEDFFKDGREQPPMQEREALK